MVTSGNVVNIAKDRLNLNFFRLLSIDVLFVRLFYVSFHVYNWRYAKFSRAKWGREWGKFRKRRPKRRYAILALWANCSDSHCTVYEAAESLYILFGVRFRNSPICVYLWPLPPTFIRFIRFASNTVARR